MSRWRRVALAAALLCVGSAGTASAQSAGPTDSPTLMLSVPAATVGQQVTVSGQHFAPTTAMSMQVCGNEARNGSTDCDVVAGQTILTDEHGNFRNHLNVRFPPVACPCVVWVTSHSGPPMSASAPIGVIAADYTAPPPDATTNAADVEIVRVELVQGSGWRGWIGLPVTARLRLTVRNPGERTIAHPVLSLNLGRGDDPSGVLDAPQIDALQAGEQRTVEIPVTLGPLAHGSYTVKGRIGGAHVTFHATTSVFPWGLMLLVVGVTLWFVTWLIRRPRSRRSDEQVALAVSAASTPEASTDDDVIAPPIVPHHEDAITMNLTDDDLPQVATDDELVAWGASLVCEATDADWLTGGDVSQLAPPDEIIDLDPLKDAHPLVDVAFALPGYEEAQRVNVAGEFNDWSPNATPMQFRSGLWRAIVALEPDRDYRYRFLVNGEQWVDDPFTNSRVPNGFGGNDCVVHARAVELSPAGSPV